MKIGCVRGTVNMSSLSNRNRFDCLDTMATCTRRKLPAGSSVHGAENAPTRLGENQSRQPLARANREEVEFEAGVKKEERAPPAWLAGAGKSKGNHQKHSFHAE